MFKMKRCHFLGELVVNQPDQSGHFKVSADVLQQGVAMVIRYHTWGALERILSLNLCDKEATENREEGF